MFPLERGTGSWSGQIAAVFTMGVRDDLPIELMVGQEC